MPGEVARVDDGETVIEVIGNLLERIIFAKKGDILESMGDRVRRRRAVGRRFCSATCLSCIERVKWFLVFGGGWWSSPIRGEGVGGWRLDIGETRCKH